MTSDEVILYEERAAIMELDGGLTRAEAEREALKIVWAVPVPDQQELF